ncbi:MAG: DNA gyrase/topoisomerase IV subunit A [Bacteroidota bacterium]
MSKIENKNEENSHGELDNITHVSGMFKNWFIDYASYVILERAVPAIQDGLKPVQRRILHSMDELEDGRYNKVANVIGHAMKYHPHGDASIGDAMVQLGQKDLLIDMQGNWGNILTGDNAAAARYIEARLSKFALDVVFNPKTTNWQPSYDGRNKEPITLPIKFPLLLAQGVEGIAVGLATKIMPHNFIELIDASIDILRGKRVNIVPDFPTAGMADFTNYNEGLRGGKIRVRAKIKELDKKTLVITEIPFGTTTTSLIESIISANDKEKIKVKKIEDNTAEFVEILVHLAPGISPDITIDGLYAFTACEVSISPNSCVIDGDRPRFLSVNEILKISTHNTVDLLKKELEIRKSELMESFLMSSLEKIFIREEMYIDFKNFKDKLEVFEYLDKRFTKHKKSFFREIGDADYEKLTQIPMIRITRYDSDKADEKMRNIEEELKVVAQHLANLIDFAVEYFKNLKKKYAKGKERKTEIRSFENIVATTVAVANEKLYVNREEGFAGYGLKKDEYVSDCSDIDDIIVFREDGTVTVSKIQDKAFVGKGILHIAVFKKNDERTIYNLIYQDGKSGPIMMKRFFVSGVTRDKAYDLTKGSSGSNVLYLTVNPNGEAEVLTMHLKAIPKVKNLVFDVDFGKLAIKGRSSIGNIVTKYPVRKIIFKEKGGSTLGARGFWFDDTIHRLNTEGKGQFLGDFTGDDKILTVTQDGFYKLYNYDLTNHFDENIILIEKFKADKPLSVIYFDGEKKEFYIKRFMVELTDKKNLIITEAEGSYIELVSSYAEPKIDVKYAKEKGKEIEDAHYNLAEVIEVKGLKARGNRFTTHKIKEINLHPSPDEDIAEPEAQEPKGTGMPSKATSEAEIDDIHLERIRSIKAELDDMDSQMTLF